MPSFILIHPAVSPQQTWIADYTDAGKAVKFECRGCCAPFRRELDPHLTRYGRGRGLYLPATFHLDPSNRLATVHQRHKRTGQDRHNGLTEYNRSGRQFVKRFALYAIKPLFSRLQS